MRLFIRAFLGIAFATLLAGCGFQMRGDWQLPSVMSQTVISGNFSSQLYDELKRNFKSASASLTRHGKASSQTQLRIHEERVDRRVLSIGGRTGKAVEYELYYIVEFDVVDASGQVIVPRQQMNLTRDYLYEETNVIGTNRQENLLRDDLRRDIVHQMMRRFQAQAK